jgi:hypothetical protein
MTVESIVTSIKNLFGAVRVPLVPIPAMMLGGGASGRPGISSMMVASNVIRRLPEVGAPVGPNTDGTANIYEGIVRLIVEEVVKAIKLDGKIEIAIPPDAIKSVGQGGNAGGPVVVVSKNVNPVQGVGVLR